MTFDPRHTADTNAGLDAADQDTSAASGGTLVINLCEVESPITIPQPRSPRLARFSFFLSHRWEGGRRKYQLHMGHFNTRAEADKWLKILLGIYPNAFVSDIAAARTESLTDTHVLKILEQRGAAAAGGAGSTAGGVVSLLGPDETAARRALKDAVERDESVAFVVQLQWSAQPVDLATLPQHPIFAPYTLYQVPTRHAGREWFGLRLGFFSDAISAKQVAQYVRADFASVAVVPITSKEHSTVVGKASLGTSVTARPQPAAVHKEPVTAAAPTPRSRPGTTLEDTLETLRASQFDMGDDDDMNSTGVRHLRIEVEKEFPSARKTGKPALRARKP